MTASTKTTSGGRSLRRVPRILFMASLGASAAAAQAPMAQAHDTGTKQSAQLAPPDVPGDLVVEDGNKPFLMYHAYGSQNYICLGAGMAWTFIGPQATLFDDGKQAATHFLSPNPDESGVVARATWQHSKNTDAVWAFATKTYSEPDYVDPDAIAWLLLKVVGRQAGQPGGGERLWKTTFIQRVNTVGGKAPAGGCPSLGARVFAPYETDYVFYKSSTSK